MQAMSLDRGRQSVRRDLGNMRRRQAERPKMPEAQVDHDQNAMTEQQADAIDGILVEWADWSRGYRMRIGYPQKSAGFEPGGGAVTAESSGHQYDDVLSARCEIVDRCIDDLPTTAQTAAIHRRYLSAVYRMRDYEATLSGALVALLVAFRRKGVLWG